MERAELSRTLGEARHDGRPRNSAAISLRHESSVRHTPSPHGSARRKPRPPRSARRRIFPIFPQAKIKAPAVSSKRKLIASGADVVLVSQGLDHIMRPLANHLGVERILCNRLDFRNGLATGRLIDPVIRPRGAFAKLTGRQPNGQVSREILLRSLGYTKNPQIVDNAIQPAQRPSPQVSFPSSTLRRRMGRPQWPSLLRARLAARQKHSSHRRHGLHRQSMARKSPHRPPEIGRIYLLVRRNKANTALARFRRVLEESPVFEQLAAEHGDGFAISCESEFRSLRATSAALVLAWPQM